MDILELLFDTIFLVRKLIILVFCFLIGWCLAPTLAIFQLYRGVVFLFLENL